MNNNLTTNDLKQIAKFKKIMLAYEKIIFLLKRENIYHDKT